MEVICSNCGEKLSVVKIEQIPDKGIEQIYFTCSNCGDEIIHMWPIGTDKLYERQPIKIPPIGIEPKGVWIARRRINLREAIQRRMDAEMYIPVEWIEEWNKLSD